MSYPPCRYARRWPELWAQLRSDNDRRRLSQNLGSGRLDGQEPSRAFVAAFIDRMLGRITRQEFLAGDHHLPPCTRTPYQPSHHPDTTHSSAGAVTNHPAASRPSSGRTAPRAVRHPMLPRHRYALTCPRSRSDMRGARHAGRRSNK